jgi:ribosome maturation factor RimP
VSADRERLAALLQPPVTAAGLDLEDVTVSTAGRRSVVRVVVDRDGGVSLDDVAEVSRGLSEVLDAVEETDPGVLTGSYTLEVSSPGVDRPLTAPRHWRRNIGRLVTVTLRDGGTATGRVVEAGDGDSDGLVLDVDGARRALRYAEVSRGVVQVEFSRPGGEEAGT